MDSIKISSRSMNEVRPSQTLAKERDEGFVSTRTDRSEQKTGDAKSAKDNMAHNQSSAGIESERNSLIEQRKQELAQQLSEKEKSRDQADKFEELSAQRKLESRAAANNQKIKNSYAVVQQDNSQQKIDNMRSEKSEAAKSHETSQKPAADPINLVV